MTYLVHIAYVLYLLSYSVRDILWLRAITIVASVALLPYYFYFEPEPLYAPMIWLSLFTLINVVQIVILIFERRPITLSEEETELYYLVFRTLKPRDFSKLLKLAVWKEVGSDEVIVQQEADVGGLFLLTDGRARIEAGGRPVAEVKPGQFVGEMSYLTGDVASAQVTATRASRFLFWPSGRLNEFLGLRPDLNAAFKAVLGVDLVTKIKDRTATA